jgi:hypothetical protein
MSNKKPRGKSLTNTTGRIVVVGDLHGCFNEATELLDQLQVTSLDTIIFAGDMIDRGPYSAKCVDLAMAHEAVLGNHEDHHFRYRKLQREGGDLSKISPIEKYLIENPLEDTHLNYFDKLPHFIRLPQYASAVVHAGVWPGLALEDQNPDYLMRLQYICPSKSQKNYWSIKRPIDPLTGNYDPDFKFWTEFWDGPERIIFGHSVLNKPLITEKVVGIDGGCCFGEELFAFTFPEMKVFCLPSRQSRTERPKLHLIRDDVGTY